MPDLSLVVLTKESPVGEALRAVMQRALSEHMAALCRERSLTSTSARALQRQRARAWITNATGWRR